jgi:hypothetical protein
VISEVFLGRPATFIKLHNLQHIFCHETSYRPRTVTGDNDGLSRTEQKARSMEILLFFFIISSGNSRCFLRDQAITDRISNPQFIDCLSRFFDRVGRSCNDLGLFGFELLV